MGAHHPNRYGVAYGGAGHRVKNPGPSAPPPHDDPVKALLGGPRAGESALDRKAMQIDLAGGRPERFRIDWSKMSATRGRVNSPNGWQGNGVKLEGDIDDNGE